MLLLQLVRWLCPAYVARRGSPGLPEVALPLLLSIPGGDAAPGALPGFTTAAAAGWPQGELCWGWRSWCGCMC